MRAPPTSDFVGSPLSIWRTAGSGPGDAIDEPVPLLGRTLPRYREFKRGTWPLSRSERDLRNHSKVADVSVEGAVASVKCGVNGYLCGDIRWERSSPRARVCVLLCYGDQRGGFPPTWKPAALKSPLSTTCAEPDAPRVLSQGFYNMCLLPSVRVFCNYYSAAHLRFHHRFLQISSSSPSSPSFVPHGTLFWRGIQLGT